MKKQIVRIVAWMINSDGSKSIEDVMELPSEYAAEFVEEWEEMYECIDSYVIAERTK